MDCPKCKKGIPEESIFCMFCGTKVDGSANIPTPIEQFEWEIQTDGTIKINRYIGNDEDVVIPSQIDGRSVTLLNDCAFYLLKSVKSISIPDSVTRIGWGAFYCCRSLVSVNIPDSVTYIESWVFIGCSSLTSITIPNGVNRILPRMFQDCSSLSSITIPDSVTEIGESAFENCTSLTSITLPDGVEIDVDAFKGTPLEDKYK